MSIKDDLRALRVFNAHNAVTEAQKRGYTGSDVYLAHRAQQSGRASVIGAWQVHRPGHKTDPGSFWQDYGAKTFIGKRANQAVLDEALSWAAARYGEQGWTKMPGLPGALMPKALVDFWRAELRRAGADPAHPTPGQGGK